MRGRRWELILATVGWLAVVAFVVVAAVTALPPVLANLSSIVSSGEVFAVGDDAEVTVPDGWSVRESDAAVEVRTPDGVMTAVVALAPDPSAASLDALLPPGVEPDAEASRGPVQTETLASGLLLAHQDVTADPAGVVATVADAESGPVVTVTAAAGDELERYRPALAEILEGIRFR
jgi:hypothetical protein